MKKKIMLLVLLLTIGFAAVSTTLVLNGTIGVASKEDDFEVIFTKAVLDGVKSNYFIDEATKQTLSFETKKLTRVNEITTLEYDVTNTSRLYDGEVSISCTIPENEYIEVEYLPTSMTIPAGETKTGSLTAKLTKSTTEDQSITIECELKANATERETLGTEYKKEEYKETLLNGADPVLADSLIPVVIENDGTVKKADTKEAWYSYEDKRWANAIILNDETQTYREDEVIPEENIESYFVWIPKYSYQLWDLGEYDSLTSMDTNKVHTIPVRFGLTNTSDEVEGECTTPMNAEKTQGLSGESGNCQIGDYMTPPAFISMGTNGLWVGKFETGYKGATSKTNAEHNENNVEKVEIKPNVYSWRNITVGNAFKTSYNYKRDLDSHMMKNTEWGAVAYLQHSAYGSATSVRINNNSTHITGYAAKNEPTCGNTGANENCNKWEQTSLGIDGTYTLNYKNPDSQVASTTGNYTGIYDMSGGAWEYVMGVRGNASAGSSGLDDNIEAKYYDHYNENSSVTSYNYRILGDATAEFGPYELITYETKTRRVGSWHNDDGNFVNSGNPWADRGGTTGNGYYSGIFSYFIFDGSEETFLGYRIVLAP